MLCRFSKLTNRDVLERSLLRSFDLSSKRKEKRSRDNRIQKLWKEQHNISQKPLGWFGLSFHQSHSRRLIYKLKIFSQIPRGSHRRIHSCLNFMLKPGEERNQTESVKRSLGLQPTARMPEAFQGCKSKIVWRQHYSEYILKWRKFGQVAFKLYQAKSLLEWFLFCGTRMISLLSFLKGFQPS